MRCVRREEDKGWPSQDKLRYLCEHVDPPLRCLPIVVENCGSTQDEARRLAEAGFPEGTLIVAREMTSGRGRLGRPWVAGPGGLWFTLILKPPLGVNAQLIPLAAGVSVAQALRLCGFEACIKWPNDVLVNGFKVSGILTEGVASTALRYILLGIGVNTNNDLPGSLRSSATSLRAISREPVSNYDLLRVFMDRMSYFYLGITGSQGGAVIKAWRKINCTLGRKVKVVLPHGEVLVGVAKDVGEDGSLLLETGEGVVRVNSGDVIHLRFGER